MVQAFAYHAASVSLRRATSVLLIALAVAAAACTGGDDPEPSGDPQPTPSELPTRDTGRVEFERGAFIYQFQNVTAELRWDGGEGELTVDNRSGKELGAPGLYAVTDSQQEIDAEVLEGAPIPTGSSTSFTVRFPDDLGYDEMGLLVLLFGDQNWGAFAPVPVEDESAEQ